MASNPDPTYPTKSETNTSAHEHNMVQCCRIHNVFRSESVTRLVISFSGYGSIHIIALSLAMSSKDLNKNICEPVGAGS